MPHLVVLYSANLDARTDMTALCRGLADAMVSVRDEQGKPIFPTGGVRVFAYPAAHYAIADGGAAGRAAGGSGDYGFVYLNLRMGRGRGSEVKEHVGRTLEGVAMRHLQALLEREHVGITLQVDEGQEAFDAKNSSLHPLFRKA